MCRNIRPLFNFDPPATPEEIHAASLQFVRKITGLQKPSQANQVHFTLAVEEIGAVCSRLLDSMATSAAPKNCEAEAVKARARASRRFQS